MQEELPKDIGSKMIPRSPILPKRVLLSLLCAAWARTHLRFLLLLYKRKRLYNITLKNSLSDTRLQTTKHKATCLMSRHHVKSSLVQSQYSIIDWTWEIIRMYPVVFPSRWAPGRVRSNSLLMNSSKIGKDEEVVVLGNLLCQPSNESRCCWTRVFPCTRSSDAFMLSKSKTICYYARNSWSVVASSGWCWPEHTWQDHFGTAEEAIAKTLLF